jgi:uncharacterized alkaline shock family protein YloU
MAENNVSQAQSSTSTPGSAGPSRSTPAQRAGATLQTERGSTSIANTVVEKIIAIAVREVGGVAQLGGGASGALGSVVTRLRSGQDPSTAGVNVEVGERQAAVDLTLKVTYPASIHEVADAVRQNVIDRVESMTGLQVTEVNVSVADLAFPAAEQEQQEPQRVQ